MEDLVDIEEQILEAYEAGEEEQDNRAEQPEVKKITVEEAIQALAIRIQYEEQSGDGEGDKLLQLERDMRQLQLKRSSPKVR